MTGRGGKKRHSSQPLGAAAKDARPEDGGEVGLELGAAAAAAVQAGDMQTWSQVASRRGGFESTNRYGLLAQANSYQDKSMRSTSVSSRGSRRGSRAAPSTIPTTTGETGAERQEAGTQDRSDLNYSESSLGSRSKFVTPPPDGAYRDDFAIEFQQLNGKPFKGSITVKEARHDVFKNILGFNPALLHSIRPVFGGTPTIRFKLKEQINIDELTSVEYFDLERRVSTTRTDIISCRIMGIRGLQAAPNYDGTSNDVRWVKIENCEYLVEEEDILDWMRMYGEPLSLLGEDMLPDSDSEGGPLGNGTYSLKMKLVKDIPQFLPMHGRKIRIYFKNMTKMCTNCYGCHTRRQCTNERVPWIVYVRDFMKSNPDIGENFYGKWWDAVDSEFPGYFDQDIDDGQAEHQTESNEPQREVGEIPTFKNQTRAKPPIPNVQRNPPRHSRDPRVQRQQQQHQQQSQSEDQDEIANLMQKGLTLTDATTYIRNKRDQQQIEQRMYNPGTTGRNVTKIGPTSTSRGGLSFN